MFWFEACDGLGAARVEVRSHRNLGWNGGRLVDCVKSEDRLALTLGGYQECFWTGGFFTGWSGDTSGGVQGYASILSNSGLSSSPVNPLL